MKTLCDLSKKELEKHAGKIIKAKIKPGYFCAKCARASGIKKQLCTPEEINYK